MLREVHEQRAVGLLYGQRGLMVGAADPVVVTGTFETSKGAPAPFERLVRTAKIFEAINLGSKIEADAVLERVHSLHSRVNGELSFDAGPAAAGTRYDAYEPNQMLWTLGCIADSALYFYELLVRETTPAEREDYWRDYVLWGGLFGLSAETMPSTYSEFRSWFDGRLAGQEMYLTEHARDIGRMVALELPAPPYARAPLQLANLMIIGSLPRRLRKMYGLRWTPAHAAAFAATARAHRTARPLVPRSLRRGPCERNYELIGRSEGRYGRRQAERSVAAMRATRRA